MGGSTRRTQKKKPLERELNDVQKAIQSLQLTDSSLRPDWFGRLVRLHFESRITSWLLEARKLTSTAERELGIPIEAIAEDWGFDLAGRLLAEPGFIRVAGKMLFFPIAEAAWRFLTQREVLPFEQWKELSDFEQRHAFTMAEVQSTRVLTRVRDLLAEAVHEGWGRDQFERRVDEAFEQMGVTPAKSWRIERIFRTETGLARADAHDQMLSDSVVGVALPFDRYDAIDDSRVERDFGSSHIILDDWVFLRDDPIWNSGEQPMRPPRRPNCRCQRTAMSIRQFLRAYRRRQVRYGSGPITVVDPDTGGTVEVPTDPAIGEVLREAGVPENPLFSGLGVYEVPQV